MLTKDRALALAVLLVMAIMFAETANIAPRSSWQPYSSAFYPRLLLSVIGLLAMAILIRSFLPSAERQAPLLPSLRAFLSNNLRIIALFALFVLFAALLPVVGFRLSAIGFLLLSLALLWGLKTPRDAVIVIGVAVGASLLIYVAFHYGLGIRLP